MVLSVDKCRSGAPWKSHPFYITELAISTEQAFPAIQSTGMLYAVLIPLFTSDGEEREKYREQC